jgi:hypothetical protein
VYPANLVRWAGLLATVAGILFVVIDFSNLLVLVFADEQDSELLVISTQLRPLLLPVAGALLSLGLVGLYASQSKAVGVPGLAGFLLAFLGTVLALNPSLPFWPSALGWGIFGVASLQAQVFPRLPVILLTTSAVLAGTFGPGVAGGLFAYASVFCIIVFDTTIVWIGFHLFTSWLGSTQAASLYGVALGGGSNQEREKREEFHREVFGAGKARLKNRLRLAGALYHVITVAEDLEPGVISDETRALAIQILEREEAAALAGFRELRRGRPRGHPRS